MLIPGQVSVCTEKNCFAEALLLDNLIWVQCSRWLTDREQTQGLPRATDWSLGTELVSAGLDSTWPHRTKRFIYRTTSVCACARVYLPMRARVSHVFAQSPRREFVLSAPQSIHQGWHFLPFYVQTKHLATCAISTLRDVERPDLWDLSVRNYTIVTPNHWFGTLPLLLFFLW